MMPDHTPLSTRIATGVIAILLLVPAGIGFMPRQAAAFWGIGDIVHDPVGFVKWTISSLMAEKGNLKEYVLDPIAYAAAQKVREAIVRSIVNWANGGFEGSPAFTTNITQSLRGLGDTVERRFMQQLGLSGSINSPFRDLVIQGVRVRYQRDTSTNAFFASSRYTLNRYSSNDAAFLRGDFHLGGLRAWVEAWRNPLNNPIGAFNAINGELQARVVGAQGNRVLELNWGRGLMSWCAEPEGSAGDNAVGEDGPVDLTPPAAASGGSPDCQIRTPGMVIAETINKGLGSNIDSIVSADEIDEIIGAIISGLTNKLLGDGGLAGLSQPSEGGGPSFIDEATSGSTLESGSLSGNFNGMVTSQINEIREFKTNWERIKTAAQNAKQMCAEKENDPKFSQSYSDEVNATLAVASTSVARADTALTALISIQTRVAEGTAANDTAKTNAALNEYQKLIASPTLPAPNEIADVGVQTQDLQGLEPPTLYTRMRIILDDKCLSSP